MFKKGQKWNKKTHKAQANHNDLKQETRGARSSLLFRKRTKRLETIAEKDAERNRRWTQKAEKFNLETTQFFFVTMSGFYISQCFQVKTRHLPQKCLGKYEPFCQIVIRV